jgi:PAS domain S-box-containing protein
MTQRLMAAASEGIVVTHAAQRITSSGAGADRIFGWREQEILGQLLSVLIPDRYRTAHPQHVQDFATEGGGVHHMAERGEVTGLHRDGREIPAMVTVAGLGGRGGDGLIAVVSDLSIRKAQPRKLAESECRYRQAVVPYVGRMK